MRSPVVAHFDARFRALGTAHRAASTKAYMKSELAFHGVDMPTLRREVTAYAKAHAFDRATLVAAVDALFAEPAFDLRTAAIALLEKHAALLGEDDLAWLVELARTGGCWAHVDFLATAVIEPVVARSDELAAHLRAWAIDESFWVRRVALLAQLRALRTGGGDFALFEEIAAPMLGEKEFFIRKAIGWVLREVSKQRPKLVAGFLRRHEKACSGVTLREARKYLPSP